MWFSEKETLLRPVVSLFGVSTVSIRCFLGGLARADPRISQVSTASWMIMKTKSQYGVACSKYKRINTEPYLLQQGGASVCAAMDDSEVQEARRAAKLAADEADAAKVAVTEAEAVKKAASARTAELRRQLAAFDAAEAAKGRTGPSSRPVEPASDNFALYQPRFMGPLGHRIDAAPASEAPAVAAAATAVATTTVQLPVLAPTPSAWVAAAPAPPQERSSPAAASKTTVPSSAGGGFTYEPRFMLPFRRPVGGGVGGSAAATTASAAPITAAVSSSTGMEEASEASTLAPPSALASLSEDVAQQKVVADEASKEAAAAKAALDASAKNHAAAAARTAEIKRQIAALDAAEAAAKGE